MSKNRRSEKNKYLPCDSALNHSPFANLLVRGDTLPEQVLIKEPAEKAPNVAKKFSSKLVLRFERKGHGGKSITVLSGVVLDGEELKAWARVMAKALGTRVRIEGRDLMLSGDQRARAKVWLEEQGAMRIVLSG